jgi:hypothetical protein
MRVQRLICFTLVVLAAGCARQEPPAEPVAAPALYQLATDIPHFMELVLDPAADKIWDSAGTIITAEGERELAPTTDEGWRQVMHAAAVLAEGGNLLMLPGRAAGDDWLEYSRGLTAAGSLALKAAEARDSDALFDAGGRLYQVCKACHTQYWVEEETAD